MNHCADYKRHFVSTISKFISKLHLVDSNRRIIVAVSGGVDSLVLLQVMNVLYPGAVGGVHINHGTRIECAEEEKIVRKFCEENSIKLDIVRLSLDLNESNFELRARELRNSIFKKFIIDGAWVYTGHHIDDSFEWSMIQSFKQCSIASTLGIPVFNNGLVRPLMCVTKYQIKKYARIISLNWKEDKSNDELRFERNYFRNKISPAIELRYPAFLRNYVFKQNELALRLKVHRLLQLQKQAGGSNNQYYEILSSGLRDSKIIRSNSFETNKAEVVSWIKSFSSETRGKLDKEVEKLIEASKLIQKSENVGPRIKGPFSFSGGVVAYLAGDTLFITNRKNLKRYEEIDRQLSTKVKALDKINSQITFGLLTVNKKIIFPQLVILNRDHKRFQSKLIHPLLPQTCKGLKNLGIPYSFYPLIPKNLRQTIDDGTTVLDSSILDL